MPEELITADEIARRFNRKLETVNGWFRKGLIEGINPLGKQWFTTAAGLAKFQNRPQPKRGRKGKQEETT